MLYEVESYNTIIIRLLVDTIDLCAPFAFVCIWLADSLT